MGKRARDKKQVRLEALLQERQAIAVRQDQARRPTMRLIKRLTVAVIATVILIYVGQVVNHKIARASQSAEEQR